MPEVPDILWRTLLYALAAAGLAAALVVMWRSRRSHGLSPTRALIGLSLGVLAYHAAAYASPQAWFPIQIPKERFWMVLLAAVVGLTVSAWMDRRAAADQAEQK